MSNSRIKQIKRILAQGDVRDPRAMLVAIEAVLLKEKAAKPEAVKPLIKVVGRRMDAGAIGLSITTDKSIKPIELYGVIKSLRGHGDELFGVKREESARCDLSELFKKFEAELVETAKQEGVRCERSVEASQCWDEVCVLYVVRTQG